jgi:hypothetical protein
VPGGTTEAADLVADVSGAVLTRVDFPPPNALDDPSLVVPAPMECGGQPCCGDPPQPCGLWIERQKEKDGLVLIRQPAPEGCVAPGTAVRSLPVRAPGAARRRVPQARRQRPAPAGGSEARGGDGRALDAALICTAPVRARLRVETLARKRRSSTARVAAVRRAPQSGEKDSRDLLLRLDRGVADCPAAHPRKRLDQSPKNLEKKRTTGFAEPNTPEARKNVPISVSTLPRASSIRPTNPAPVRSSRNASAG